MLDEAPFWRCTLRLLLLAGLFSSATCQSEDDSSLHFSNAQSGRAVWLVEESNLPWVGSYEYLSSLVAENTALLTVVDSSTGRTLGECTSQSHGSKWVRFQWALASDSMQCTVSPTNSSRVVFPQAQGPRTFSVRIQAGRGPACIRQMIVQNERPVGCPPHLARNSFSSLHLSCSCPYEVNSAETTDSVDPQFPIFELGTPSPSMETPAFTISPCATHRCQHNGTCVVTQEGQATCLCQQGFIGAQCEVDVCASVPCQNGGVCKTNGAEATCQCKPGYSGILCESASCNPECSNGDCVVTNGTAHCKCRQGFIGINCNVVDVCLGDAACAMFGDAAKCVLEAQNYIMHSASLVNASYDCRCPHPVNGEFVDCLELHLSSVATSSLTTAPPTHQPEILPNPGATAGGMQPHPSGVQPSVVPEMFPNLGGGEPGLLPTKPTVAPSSPVTEGSTAPAVQPSRPTFGIHPVPQFPQTQFPFSGFPTATTTQQVAVTTQTPEVEPHSPTHPQLPSTFVFPQTVQTTTQKVVEEHQPTHAITTEEPEEEATTTEEAEEEPMPTPSSTFGFIPHSFPTPAPMDMNHASTGGRPIDFNPFHSLMSTSQQPPVVQTTTTTTTMETTTMEEEVPTTTEEATTHGDYEEHEDSEEMVSTEVVHPSHPVTQFVMPTTEQTPEPEVPTTNEVFTEPTTHSTLPFWMFSTQPPPRVIPQNPHDTFGFKPTPGRPVPEEEHPVEEVMPPVKETTVVPTDVHQQETGHADHQSSSAVSWIVAILALIVLGLLLLAAALFVLRYIKQSRKLHGKYNPAREEHALSAAYSMPMSHITKEERLI